MSRRREMVRHIDSCVKRTSENFGLVTDQKRRSSVWIKIVPYLQLKLANSLNVKATLLRDSRGSHFNVVNSK